MSEPASSARDHAAFRRWLGTPLGQWLLRREDELLRERLPALHGDALLWCAPAPATPDLSACRVAFRVLMLPESPVIGSGAGRGVGEATADRAVAIRSAPAAPIVSGAAERGSAAPHFATAMAASLDAVPFRTSSFHAVVVQHGFEGADDVHASVREVTRVLDWGGRLIVVGFNPLSAWGARRALTPRDRRTAPWDRRFVAAGRVVDWLTLLGLRVLETAHVVYRPPLGYGTARRERVARRWPRRQTRSGLPVMLRLPLGAVYLIHARKEGAAGTVIRPAWRRVRPVLVPASAPQARVGANLRHLNVGT